MKKICRKKRFRDEIQAKLVLARIQRIDNPKRETDERRVYFHKDCHAWHLTSQPQRTELAYV